MLLVLIVTADAIYEAYQGQRHKVSLRKECSIEKKVVLQSSLCFNLSPVSF